MGDMFRGSRPEVFCRKGSFEFFVKFTGKNCAGDCSRDEVGQILDLINVDSTTSSFPFDVKC